MTARIPEGRPEPARRSSMPWLCWVDDARAALVFAISAFMLSVAGPVSAGTILITDFTAPADDLATHGGIWTWNSATDSPPRTLGVGGRNTSADYLEQAYVTPLDIAGAVVLRLTGNWTPYNPGNPDASGSFVLNLIRAGDIIASSTFTFQEFGNGPQTREHSLTWSSPPPVSATIDIWQIVGAGSPSTTLGDMQLTEMLVATTAVPEIDPAGSGSVLTLVAGALGLLERRRRTSA